MATIENNATFKAGQQAPVTGAYECDSACGHTWSTSTPAATLPELPDGCAGAAWRLRPAGPVTR